MSTVLLTAALTSGKVSDMALVQELVERVYQGDLASDVAKWRDEGKSWRTIADLVSDECELTVSYETLRTWYNNDSLADSA